MILPVLALLPTAALLASAHSGCDGYQHGVDLWKRDPAQEEYIQRLQARYPEVNARVDHGGLLKRQQSASPTGPVRATGALTRINSAAVAALSSGTGTAEATSALPTTYPAGSRSPVSGAPVLPQVVINPADWPTLDRPPPTDTPQVQQWLSEIDLSGIPTFSPTQTGYCANASNADAVSQASQRCWWTCGGCTRATDITFCPARNTWGVSYDDGPSPYTPKLLDFMDQAGVKSTIFTVGSRVISRPEMVQYEYMAGHQLAVHTWSHFPLTTLTNEQIVAEFGWSKKAIHDVTGVTPAYMRPPYGDIDDRVRYIALQMGLTPVIWTAYNGQTFDTRDWQIAGGVVAAPQVAQTFDQILTQLAPQMSTGFIVLAHDLYQQSVDLAVNYVLPLALGNSALTLEPIISCLGYANSEAYIETKTNRTLSSPATLVGASGSGFVPGQSAVATSAIGGGATGSRINSNAVAAAATSSRRDTSDGSKVALQLGFAAILVAASFLVVA